jgi:hypothetical protein
MAKRFHACVDIETALNNRKILRLFEDGNGNTVHPSAVKEFLKAELKKGKSVYTPNCNNQDAEGGCLGHPCEES